VEANMKRRAVYMVVSLCVCEVVMKAKEKYNKYSNNQNRMLCQNFRDIE
jgi:hypothetical protein